MVNPYKRYPIYTHRVCKIYLGKRRNEVNLNLTKNTGWLKINQNMMWFNTDF